MTNKSSVESIIVEKLVTGRAQAKAGYGRTSFADGVKMKMGTSINSTANIKVRLKLFLCGRGGLKLVALQKFKLDLKGKLFGYWGFHGGFANCV